MKIPQKIIQNCVGLAIFTVMRTGLWVSGAGDSGVLIARKEDGSWSPPSGILIHTLGVGFMAGIDIYDCVLVINDRKALSAFSKLRVSLGGEVSLAAGPLGIGGNVESELLKNRKPVWTYMKSRGLYGGIQFDGTVVIERNDENARFYGERLPISQILAGNVRRVPPETRMLMEVVKEAEGRTDLDQAILAEVHNQPPPSEVDVESINQPTTEQQQYFAPPQGFYAPEKTDYAHLGAQGSAPRPSSQGQGFTLHLLKARDRIPRIQHTAVTSQLTIRLPLRGRCLARMIRRTLKLDTLVMMASKAMGLMEARRTKLLAHIGLVQ